MPGGDRTGPMGAGAMTGRGAGYCAGFGMPGYANPMPGRGFGMGGGRGGGFGRGFGRGFGGGGRGWRNMYYATGLPGWARPYGSVADVPPYEATAASTGSDELAYLKDQAKYFNETLKDINKRIDELKKQHEDKK